MRDRTYRYPTDDELLLLWRAGKNSNEIAKLTWAYEADVAKRLPRILQIARQDREWNFDRMSGA